MRDHTREEFPIFATAPGVVRSVEDGTVVIEHDDGLFVRLFHVQAVAVAVGDRVDHGQQIGTGRAW